MHVLATESLHDGGGIFTLVWSLVVIPLSLGLIVNYRGMADRMRQRRRGRRNLSSPLSPRGYGIVFLAAGLLAMILAIHRFAQGGY